MPPQVPKADAGTTVHSHPVSVEQSNATEVDKNAVQKQEPPKEDAQTAAKNAEAAKQHAAGKKQQNVADEQMVRTKLDQRVPDKKTDKAPTTGNSERQKPAANQSDKGAWGFVKHAAQYTANIANAGVGVLRESVAAGAAADAAEKAAQVERGKAIVKRGTAVLDGEIELAASGKSSFANVERAIGNLDAYNREAPGAEIKQLLLQKDESVKKLLGPYGYETVDYGQRFPEDRKITQTEVLDTALHNWRNTPLEARKAIHAGDYMNLPDDYKKNWQPVDGVKIAQQNRATESDQVVRNAPLPGDHGRSYEGPRRNQPDPGLVSAQAKKDFTDASFQLINSLGGGLPAEAPGSPATVVNPKRSSTTGRPIIIDTSRSAPAPQRNVAETQPGPPKSSNVPQNTNSTPIQQQSQPTNKGQDVAKSNSAYSRQDPKATQNINLANKQAKSEVSSTKKEMDKRVKDSHVNEKNPADSTKPGDAKGANAPKTNRMSRPANEIAKEIAEAQAEQAKAIENARTHLREQRKDKSLTGEKGGSLNDQLRGLAELGDEFAGLLLRELEQAQKRLRNLHRETGDLKGDPEYLP